MPKAGTLTDKDFHRLIEHVAKGRHSRRNQLMLQMTHYAGFRVGELAEILLSDLMDAEGRILEQVALQPHQTKGKTARVVFLPAKLRDCIAHYIKEHAVGHWLFSSQKHEKFSANTLQATLTAVYKNAGLADAPAIPVEDHS